MGAQKFFLKVMIKRITPDKAKQYISCENDFTAKDNENARYFTLTPSPEGDGWEDVTYYTSRKIDLYKGLKKDYDSWVYILSNPATPNMFKIGHTKQTPNKRAKQISSSTGVALPYEVEWAFHCFNGEGLEKEVHNALEEYRISGNREFFSLPLEEAKSTIELIGQMYI